MGEYIQTRDIVMCEKHMDEDLTDFCLYCRIRELETKVAELEEESNSHWTRAHLLGGDKRKLKRQLAAIAELPGKWRDEADISSANGYRDAVHFKTRCADELQNLLQTPKGKEEGEYAEK